MHHFPRYCVLSTALVVMTLLAISLGQRLGNRSASRRSLDDWDIPELADHLNRAGLKVRLRFTGKNGRTSPVAYLTTTNKDWEDLNHLVKDSSRIHEWRGTVSCERVGKGEPMLRLLGDHYLAAGLFVFFGDVEMLKRIDAAFASSALPAAS